MSHKLLLADDSVTIQRVIELTFADEDIRVIAVGDGRQAIRELETSRPDIVLADVGMPEADGYEVAAFMKRTPALAEVPILLLTGAFEPIDEGRANAVGCDGVLVKPFEPQMVIKRVKDLLEGRGRDSSRTAGASRREFVTPDSSSLGKFQPETSGPSAMTDAKDRTAKPAASPEDYLERLNSAFASMEGAAASSAGRTASPSAEPPSQSPPPSAAPWSGSSTRTPAPVQHASQPVSLADAFSALLAAELGRPF